MLLPTLRALVAMVPGQTEALAGHCVTPGVILAATLVPAVHPVVAGRTLWQQTGNTNEIKYFGNVL